MDMFNEFERLKHKLYGDLQREQQRASDEVSNLSEEQLERAKFGLEQKAVNQVDQLDAEYRQYMKLISESSGFHEIMQAVAIMGPGFQSAFESLIGSSLEEGVDTMEFTLSFCVYAGLIRVLKDGTDISVERGGEDD